MCVTVFDVSVTVKLNVNLHRHSGLVSFHPPWVHTRLGEPAITDPGAEHW